MIELPWEDSLLERKVESDLRDLLKTLVAFANSVRPGHIELGRPNQPVKSFDETLSVKQTIRISSTIDTHARRNSMY